MLLGGDSCTRVKCRTLRKLLDILGYEILLFPHMAGQKSTKTDTPKQYILGMQPPCNKDDNEHERTYLGLSTESAEHHSIPTCDESSAPGSPALMVKSLMSLMACLNSLMTSDVTCTITPSKERNKVGLMITQILQVRQREREQLQPIRSSNLQIYPKLRSGGIIGKLFSSTMSTHFREFDLAFSCE